jgi:glycosyltransferase involved in cell wall biosynthesis
MENSTHRKIKVMFIVGSLGTGGAERFVANALTNLSRSEFELYGAFYRPDRSYEIPDDVTTIVLGKFKPWDNIKAAYRFKCWIDKIKPDVIISAWSVPNIFTAETLRWTKHKPKWIARIANDPTKQEIGLYGKWAEASYKKADGFISVATDLGRVFEEKYPFSYGKVKTIHNAVNVKVLEDRAKEPVELPPKLKHALAQNHPIIISVGRLEKQKRFDLMLEAFSKLPSEINAMLVILGEGSLRKAIEQQVSTLGISESVLLPGFVTNPYAWLKTATLFSLSSDHEGMSNALLEAQALGLPAVATDCPFGTAEIVIDGKTGFVTKPGNVGQLADRMAKLLIDVKLRQKMSLAAKLRIEQNFILDNHVIKIGKLITAENLIPNRSDLDNL